jgi:hypothetical protein
MRFISALSTLLLGASLTTSVVAAPTSIDSHLERRFQNLDDDMKADKATWEAFAKHCGGGSSKRGLDKRASMDVKMGESNMMDFPIGLSTGGLLSCIGVVITGQKENGQSFRVLGHFVAAESAMESQWQKFKSDYEKAGKVDKDTTHGYMSVPDYDKKYEGNAQGFYGNKDNKEKDRIKLSKEFEDELKKRVDSLVNGNPGRFTRDVDVVATMEVNESNQVRVNGIQIS